MSGLLDGMKVLDPSWWRPMPHATQILADLGAQVLKIEPPGGDPMRAYPDIFASLARHKRSIVLDLKADDGRARALELAAEADVFCEAWRPGVAARLGLGYDALRAINPGIIYCSISGYGQSGPWRDLPGHDLNYQALGGAVAPRPHDTGEPEIPRLPAADLEAGTLAALLVCAAWGRRHLSGEGERIDVAMADAIAWWIGPNSGVRVEGADESHGGHPAYGVFRTADRRYVALAPLGEQHLFDGICKALGLDDLVGLPFLERLARTADVDARVRAAIAELNADDAFEMLERAGAPVSIALTPEEMAVHPQIQARGIVADASGTTVIALPATLSANPALRSGPLPGVGEHTDGFAEG
jgi:crotonobetainyl-CoA:carnitine CoA-transferase CaiB-like acyl-CoA transferase